MDPFSVTTPPRLLFGWGTREQLPAEAARVGCRPLVVAGGALRASGALPALLDRLRTAGLDPLLYEGVPAEPDLDVLEGCIAAAREADSVIGIGGGSVLDIAKGAAALVPTGAPARDFFAGRPVPESGLPLIALPTTSGTGSEVTWVCVLVDRAARRKASIRGPGMMPSLALVDPELTVSCPRSVTAHSGMDAFVQALEAYTSKNANPYTDALALEAVRLTWNALETAVAEPDNRPAREAMALGSMMAGVALNTSRLGLVHGLAHPLGAVTGAAHGLLCGLLLPPVIRFNREVAGPKYARIARDLALAAPGAGVPEAVEALIAAVGARLDRLGIPRRLRDTGFREEDLDWIAAETMPSGSTQANPRPVSEAEAREVLLTCV